MFKTAPVTLHIICRILLVIIMVEYKTNMCIPSCMKKLHDVVNVIPVIAKADTMTLEERDSFKVRGREYQRGYVIIKPSCKIAHRIYNT